MPSAKTIVENRSLDRYLSKCRVRHTVVEAQGEHAAHVPPSASEVRYLLAHLAKRGLNAVVIGSVGVLHHLSAAGTGSDFRPTADLDLFVPVSQRQLQMLPLPDGWRQDREAVGVTSWISPSGGCVDFLTANHQFPTGERTPHTVSRDDTASDDFPVASPVELFRLKLGTMRSRDLSDLVELAKARGLPKDSELGPLNDTQKENLGLLKMWLKAPTK